MKIEKKYDFICVGAGIMSTTLALLLKMIDESLKIAIFERLDDVALESSSTWNNAGTGHSALCELNYTPRNKEGNIEIDKALHVFSQFQTSKQFWAYLNKIGYIKNPEDFIHSCPHHSWITGKENVDFLKDRHKALQKHPFFEEMEFSTDHKKLTTWFPLIMKGRKDDEIMAATRVESGAETNYQALTTLYKKCLQEKFDVDFYFNHEVYDIDPTEGEQWIAKVKDRNNHEKYIFEAHNMFIGAGGWALNLLQKVEVPEKDGYGGFPVSGEWLVCKNRAVIEQHHAKVYTKAGVNAPPMSVPHLDTRIINDKKELLFGPFAGFSTKFLKEGNYTDLLKSIKFKNIPSLFGAFWHNLDLTKYLIEQVSLKHEDRMVELRKFYKDAKSEDWELKVAGQRVQVIKKDPDEGGVLEFGTEIIVSDCGKVTTLLGASPGASVAVALMLEVVEIAYPNSCNHPKKWEEKIHEIFPFWKKDIYKYAEEIMKQSRENNKILGLSTKGR